MATVQPRIQRSMAAKFTTTLATSIAEVVESRVAARDPAHARLTVATAVSLGVLASAMATVEIVRTLHADTALLAMGVMLSVQAGSLVKDRSATARATTSALLIPAVLTAIVLAASLASQRVAVLVVFVALAGAAVWVRRFGTRASAIGSMSFMGYFFALFLRPTQSELAAFCLIAVCAVAAQLCVRMTLLLKRPRREIQVLLHELQAGSDAALRAASRGAGASTLRGALARLDDVARAITSWQQSFRTERHIACDAPTLDALVLDARVDTEEACDALANSADQTSEVAAYLRARSTRALDLIRGLDLTRALVVAPQVGGSQPSVRPVSGAWRPRSMRWVPWHEWSPTSRIAVQAMAAASIACVVGEAISASRWYWAVMTAFIVFIGASTRGSILTRAVRRVTGTAGGIVVGVVVVAVVGDNTAMLIAVCVLSVFGMLYFGPLNYVYSSVFTTVMLVSIYRMLGVLSGNILELRLIETLCGAAIGVLCAYLIMSSDSGVVVRAKVDVYFAALDDVLVAASAPFGSLGSTGLYARVHTLEAAQSDLDTAVSSMATAVWASRSRGESVAVHLMYIATRAAAGLAQSASIRADGLTAPSIEDDTAVSDAIRTVRLSAAQTLGSLRDDPSCVAGVVAAAAAATADSDTDTDANETSRRDHVLGNLDRVSAGMRSPAAVAIMALARIDWALAGVRR